MANEHPLTREVTACCRTSHATDQWAPPPLWGHVLHPDVTACRPM